MREYKHTATTTNKDSTNKKRNKKHTKPTKNVHNYQSKCATNKRTQIYIKNLDKKETTEHSIRCQCLHKTAAKITTKITPPETCSTGHLWIRTQPHPAHQLTIHRLFSRNLHIYFLSLATTEHTLDYHSNGDSSDTTRRTSHGPAVCNEG